MKGGKQCMKFGLEMINHIIDKIYKEELPYTDSIIIGENSSGKTLLLKLFIDKTKNDRAVYFIDAVNRVFDVKKVSKTDKSPKYKKTIADLTQEQLEYWYDEIYQMALLAFLKLEHAERKKALDEIKHKIENKI